MAFNPKYKNKNVNHKSKYPKHPNNTEKDYKKFNYKPKPPMTPTRALHYDQDTIVQEALANNEYQMKNIDYGTFKQVKNVLLYRFAKKYARQHMIDHDYKDALRVSIHDLSANVGLNPKHLPQKAITRTDYFQLKAQRLSKAKQFELYNLQHNRGKAVNDYFNRMHFIKKHPTASGIAYQIQNADMRFKTNWLAGGAQIAQRKRNLHDYQKNVTDYLRKLHPNAPDKSIAFKLHELTKQRHNPTSKLNKVINQTDNHNVIDALETIRKQNKHQAKQHLAEQKAINHIKSTYGIDNDQFAKHKLAQQRQQKAKEHTQQVEQDKLAKQQAQDKKIETDNLRETLNPDNIYTFAKSFDNKAYADLQKVKPDAKGLKYGKQNYQAIHLMGQDPKQMKPFQVQNAKMYSGWIDKKAETNEKIEKNNQFLEKTAIKNQHRKQQENLEHIKQETNHVKLIDNNLYKMFNTLYSQTKATNQLSKLDKQDVKFITNHRLQFNNLPTKQQQRKALFNRYQGKIHALNTIYERNGKPEKPYRENLKALRERYTVLYKHPNISNDTQFAQAIHQQYPHEQVGHLVNNVGMNQITKEYNLERSQKMKNLVQKYSKGDVNHEPKRETYRRHTESTKPINQFLTKAQRSSIRVIATIQKSPAFVSIRSHIKAGISKFHEKVNPYLNSIKHIKQPKMLSRRHGFGNSIEQMRQQNTPSHNVTKRPDRHQKPSLSQQIEQQRQQGRQR